MASRIREALKECTSFYKPIVGKGYEKYLLLPPFFAREVKHMANKATVLEDCHGGQWPVTYSYVHSSLAFKKGWPEFYSHHDLQEGIILVFEYIKENHFFVRIFGKSAAQQKNFRNEGSPCKKRQRGDETEPDNPILAIGAYSGKSAGQQKNSGNGGIPCMKMLRREYPKPDIPILTIDATPDTPIVSESELQKCQSHGQYVEEDLTCMINRDDGSYQGEDRNIFFDLSSFEMEIDTRDGNKIETKVAPSDTKVIERAENFENVLDTLVNTSQAEIVECADTFKNVPNTKVVLSDGKVTERADKFGKLLDIKKEASHAEKFEKALQTNFTPSHTEATERIHNVIPSQTKATKHIDIFDKALESNIAPATTKITEQTKTKGDDIGMHVIRSKQTSGSSGVILGNTSRTKPSEKSHLSKDMSDDVSKFQNGHNHVRASESETPSTGSSKIAVKESDVILSEHQNLKLFQPKFRESSVSSSVPKKPLGILNNIKKELVESAQDNANGFRKESSGQIPTTTRKCSETGPVTVKVEPGQPCVEVGSNAISPFSAKVKSLSFLELPVDIPVVRKRRDRSRGNVVYLRDPVGRLWPVLYPNIFYGRAFTANWRAICEKNEIKVGDVCKFQVENSVMTIYKVDVIQRSG